MLIAVGREKESNMSMLAHSDSPARESIAANATNLGIMAPYMHTIVAITVVVQVFMSMNINNYIIFRVAHVTKLSAV